MNKKWKSEINRIMVESIKCEIIDCTITNVKGLYKKIDAKNGWLSSVLHYFDHEFIIIDKYMPESKDKIRFYYRSSSGYNYELYKCIYFVQKPGGLLRKTVYPNGNITWKNPESNTLLTYDDSNLYFKKLDNLRNVKCEALIDTTQGNLSVKYKGRFIPIEDVLSMMELLDNFRIKISEKLNSK